MELSQALTVIDSLQSVIADRDSAIGAMLAHPQVVTVVERDTVVRVASASLGWWAEWLKIAAQVLVAVLALIGGAAVQKHFKDRDERRAAAAAMRTDDEIHTQLAVSVSSVCERLRPVHDKIVRNEAVHPREIEEITRRTHTFERLIPRALQLQDQAHATQVYMWFSLAEWLPDDLDLLAGTMIAYRSHAEPEPLDAEVVRLRESLLAFKLEHSEQQGEPAMERKPKTRGEVALQRIKRVLAEGQRLGPVLSVYDPGGDEPLVTIMSSQWRRGAGP